ncbi:MAG: hypothetical protein M3R21_01020, partial [Candidatus Dormibacteraeota bacterium]|nr:hypothetical protein [Candidatus Dormibacteraeota bacterium]
MAEGLAVCGLLLSLFARETSRHVELEAAGAVRTESLGKVATEVSFHDRTMSSACQAGLVNNLNDGMAWALLSHFFAAHGLGLREIGLLASIYPAIWGAGQLGTGWISDHVGRKSLIVAGMLLQSSAICPLRHPARFHLVGCGERLAWRGDGDGLSDSTCGCKRRRPD